MRTVRHADDARQLRRCYPVMAQLRPHLDVAAFLKAVKVQVKEGYRIAYVEDEGRVLACAGYRVYHMLYAGRILYVDDLVTDEDARSGGHGGLLLDWLIEEARRQRCDSLELDSGVQRVGAHRFYLNHGLYISSYHFRIPLNAPAPQFLTHPSPPGGRRRRG